MTDPTMADLAVLFTKLAATVETLQAKFDTLEQRSSDSSSSGGRGPHAGDHYMDRPP